MATCSSSSLVQQDCRCSSNGCSNADVMAANALAPPAPAALLLNGFPNCSTRSSMAAPVDSNYIGATDDVELHVAAQENPSHTLQCMLDKEAQYFHRNYPALLRRSCPADPSRCPIVTPFLLCDARTAAVNYLIRAYCLHNLSASTVALAVNCLDRYLFKDLSLMADTPAWKVWMVELLAVACLSIAAKMEEVDVPLLLDLQVAYGLEHVFQPSTVQRMELTVLSALGWSLRPPTPLAFAEIMLRHLILQHRLSAHHHVQHSLLDRASELIVKTFPDIEFLDFEPSVIAATSICCALEEILPVQAEQLKSSVLQAINSHHTEIKVTKCYSSMEGLIVDPLYPTSSLSDRQTISKFRLSPNTVNVANLQRNCNALTSRRIDNRFSSQAHIAHSDLGCLIQVSQNTHSSPKRRRTQA